MHTSGDGRQTPMTGSVDSQGSNRERVTMFGTSLQGDKDRWHSSQSQTASSATQVFHLNHMAMIFGSAQALNLSANLTSITSLFFRQSI